jgi:alkylation response protein AidB-like acyl-CoA dehydrogenase
MRNDELVEVVEEFLRGHPVRGTEDAILRAARFDAGLAFPHFDRGFGGLGLGPEQAALIEGWFIAAGAVDWSDRNVVGLGMAAPTIHAHGSASQRELLRPLFVGEHIWCQLFSEPGAGSDLASVSTRAERDGAGWAISGQKVWTTLGHVARWGLLLARTDPKAAKHGGLSCFVLDMRLPGVDVRPLRQMTGESEFNEVFLSDVRVGDETLLGAPGDGWRVALTTLMNERVSFSESGSTPGGGTIRRALATYREGSASGRLLPASRDRLMRLWVMSEVTRLTGVRARHLSLRGTPGPEGSVGKLAMTELNKAIFEYAVDTAGPEGMLIDSYADVRPTASSAQDAGDIRRSFLRSRANSIEGGTSEVLRNVLAERVLGLPREPREGTHLSSRAGSRRSAEAHGVVQ